jgi:hypothetical protein
MALGENMFNKYWSLYLFHIKLLQITASPNAYFYTIVTCPGFRDEYYRVLYWIIGFTDNFLYNHS